MLPRGPLAGRLRQVQFRFCLAPTFRNSRLPSLLRFQPRCFAVSAKLGHYIDERRCRRWRPDQNSSSSVRSPRDVAGSDERVSREPQTSANERIQRNRGKWRSKWWRRKWWRRSLFRRRIVSRWDGTTQDSDARATQGPTMRLINNDVATAGHRDDPN